MSFETAWLPMLAVLSAVAFAALAIAITIAIRGRIRQRMAGIDRRLDQLQAETESLRVPSELVELEALISEGEARGKISAQTAGELRDYVAELRGEVAETS